MKILIRSLFFTMIFLFSAIGFSQENDSGTSREPAQIVHDKDMQEKAKSHYYPGGAEDGELRVQAQLPKPQRKIAPVVDRHESENDNQEHD